MKYLFTLLLLSISAFADGPTDNVAENIRRVPPAGIAINAADRAELEQGTDALKKEIETLHGPLVPDVQIFYNAVHYALAYDEFYKTNEIATAKSLLAEGKERATQLRDGQTPWTTATGLIVRGYRSKIDGSIQPFGLVIPATFHPDTAHQHRLDLWFHGRGENLTELDFINGRQKSPGEFTPPDTFVLHLYGRYCNANKFAGEVDAFEAMETVRREYPIDENRIAVRGFSMGGAACWHFAVHHAGLWAAAAPGAGFAETTDFLKVFQNEIITPTWYEKKLLHLYDATDYARNLFNCPTIAYSGEIDTQKQAADIMAEMLSAEGMELTHLIGPKTAHKYHPDAKAELNRRLDAIMAQGRNPVPREVRFTTWTLRYNQMLWVTVDGLEEHWSRANVNAVITDDRTVTVSTKNISALTLSMPSGLCPLAPMDAPKIIIDSNILTAPKVPTDRSWTVHFQKTDGRWSVVMGNNDTLKKRHGLQGPIDDAFMDSFIMVTPTGRAMNETTGAWVAGEQIHAIEHWRRQFRGEARVKRDRDITDEDIASSNLILWGDPKSNLLLAKMADQLPIHWTDSEIKFRGKIYSAAESVPVMIYPNPFNPKRYIVLNSGFTFREYDYLNNARQVAKLPDFAVIDLTTPVSSKAPGKIVDAGFFNEQWK